MSASQVVTRVVVHCQFNRRRGVSRSDLAMMSLPGLMVVIGAPAGHLREEQQAAANGTGALASVVSLQQQIQRTGGLAVGLLQSLLEQQQVLVVPASGLG